MGRVRIQHGALGFSQGTRLTVSDDALQLAQDPRGHERLLLNERVILVVGVVRVPELRGEQQQPIQHLLLYARSRKT